MKTKKKKKKSLLFLRDLFKNKTLTFYFINIKGLNSAQQTYLRKKSNKKEIKMKVVVNTLLKKILKLTKNPKMVDIIPFIKENTTLMWTKVNNGPAELLLTLIKKDNLSRDNIFKLALSEDILYYGKNSLKGLIEIKSKKELLSLFIQNVKNFIAKTFSLLNNLSKVIFLLKRNKISKSEK